MPLLMMDKLDPLLHQNTPLLLSQPDRLLQNQLLNMLNQQNRLAASSTEETAEETTESTVFLATSTGGRAFRVLVHMGFMAFLALYS